MPAALAGRRKTFRATFRLRANVTAETVTNGASVDIPIGTAPTAPPPESTVLPEQRRRRLARDAATIGVVRTAGACSAALNPRARAAC